MCICQVPGVAQECFSPCLQDGPATPFDLAFPVGQTVEEAAYLLPHQDPVPRHRFPVASSLNQPQIASSALKSGLQPALV